MTSRHRAGFEGPQRKLPSAAARKAERARKGAEAASVDVAADERPDEVSLPKKLKRDDDRLQPPPDDPRDAQPVLLCGIAGAAIPGGVGWQFPPGISA